MESLNVITVPYEQFVRDITNLLETKVDEIIEKKSPNIDGEEVITKMDAIKLFKVTRVTLDSWEKKGFLNKKKMGRRVYYLKSDILKMLNK
jgi:hypothetical protein